MTSARLVDASCARTCVGVCVCASVGTFGDWEKGPELIALARSSWIKRGDAVSLEMSVKCRSVVGWGLDLRFCQADSFLLLSVCVGLCQGEGLNVEVVAELLDLENGAYFKELKHCLVTSDRAECVFLPPTRRSVCVLVWQRLSTRTAARSRLRPTRSQLIKPPWPWAARASSAADNACYSSGTQWVYTERQTQMQI